jgi:GNAT superfamily N-acetyltransferase
MGSKSSIGAIRRFRSEDLEALDRLIKRTIETSYHSSYSRECMDFFCTHHSLDSILKDETALIIVIEDNGAIVATGTLVKNEIKRVFVDPNRQGEGLGSEVMRYLQAQALLAGWENVLLDASIPAKGFYDHLGYQTLSFEVIDLPSDSLHYYRMEKRLS